jgi:hypothetical protein
MNDGWDTWINEQLTEHTRMKLYEVPRNTTVRLKSTESGPPASIDPVLDAVYNFKHCDGMYSLCFDSDKNIVHLPAWSEVEIVK